MSCLGRNVLVSALSEVRSSEVGRGSYQKGEKKSLISQSHLFWGLFNFFILLFVPLLSHVQLFVTPWTAAHQAFLSFTDFLLSASIYYMSSTLSKACIIVSVDTARDKVACCITFLYVQFSWMNLNSPHEFTSLKIGIIFTWSQDAYSNYCRSDLLILKS